MHAKIKEWLGTEYCVHCALCSYSTIIQSQVFCHFKNYIGRYVLTKRGSAYFFNVFIVIYSHYAKIIPTALFKC